MTPETLAISTRRQVVWRLIPFLILLYVIAYLDRVNVSYAKLQMSEDLKFSEAVYGFGAGVFFIGYFLLEIPGTLIVERWSARLWISRIMISWGIVAVLMGFIETKMQFYVLRFLLGLAEAGFYPGIIVYLSHWFPKRDRAKAVALFMIGSPVASILGGPVSGAIMEYVHWGGLAGWRWVFILEAVPAVVCGLIVPFYLTDRPEQARWLGAAEKEWLIAELAREKASTPGHAGHNYWKVVKEPGVLLLTAIYFFGITGLYGFTLWLPTLLKSFSGRSTFEVGLLSAIPFLAALGVMLAAGWSSDRRQERIWHTAIPLSVASVAFVGSVLTQDRPIVSFALLCVVGAGCWAFIPCFWALPTALLTGASAAVAVGLINSFGNLGGFVGPYAVGFLKDRTGTFMGGVLFLAGSLLLASFCVLLLRRTRFRDR